MRNEDKAYVAPDDPTNPFYKDGSVDYGRVQGNNPLAGGEYPKAMYRAAGTELIHGHMVDTTTVYGEDEEEAFVSEGWRATPSKAAAFGKALVAEEEAKPDPRDAEIAALRAALAAKDEGEPENGEQDRPRRGRPPRQPIATEPEQA